LCFGCGNRTSGFRFLLRQLRDGQFHGARDRNPRHAFVLVDPTIRGERFGVFLARCLKFLFPRLSAFLFVIVAARRGTDDGEHNHTEKRKQKHNAKPGGEGRARLRNLAN